MATHLPTVYFVIGWPEHGKSTVGQHVSRLTGQRFGATSQLGFDMLAGERGVSSQALRSLPKSALRADLIRVCDEARRTDPAALPRHLLEQGTTVIDGIRKREELEAARALAAADGHPVRTIWVENPRRERIQDNTEVDRTDADTVILNDGSLDDLYGKVDHALGQAYSREQTVRLYRGFEKPVTPSKPSWSDDIPEYQPIKAAEGRWFADSLEEAIWYYNDAPEGTQRISYIDLPAGVAEAYRVSNLPLKPGSKSTPDNPRAFSLRPEKEFYLPKDLSQRASLAPQLPSWLNEKSLASFFAKMDAENFHDEQGVWDKPYGTCTFLNASPAKRLFEEGFEVEVCGLPDGTPAMEKDDMVGGHDWLVARKDGFEWIVDPWRVAYLGKPTAIVFDPKEMAAWYGPKEEWAHVSGVNSFAKNGWMGKHAEEMFADWDRHLSKEFPDLPRRPAPSVDEPKKALVTKAGLEIELREECRGAHSGQTDLSLQAIHQDEIVGWIDYCEYAGEPNVQYIASKLPRQGIATALAQQLQARYPNIEIGWGGLTDEGSKFLESLPRQFTPDPRHAYAVAELERVKAHIADLTARCDALPGRMPAEMRDEWNGLDDRQYALEKELGDLKPGKWLVLPAPAKEIAEPDSPPAPDCFVCTAADSEVISAVARQAASLSVALER